MKRHYNLMTIVLLALAGGLSSCLKEKPALDPKETNNVIEIYNLIPTPTVSPDDAIHPLYVSGFDIVASADFQVQVSYSGANTAPEDITVNVGIDAGALADYNAEQGTNYQVLPATFYSVDSWTVTIPKGQRVVSIPIKLFTNMFDLTKSYALPVKILSVSSGTISSNFGTVIYGIVAKNKWDGVYNMSGTFIDLTNPAFTYWGDQEYHLRTVNATQCAVYNNTLGTYGYLFLNGATPTYYGSFGLIVTFNPATDAISAVTNYYGQPSSNGRSAGLDPSGLNKFDNATHDIDIKYYLLQPGTTIRSKFAEHWDYVGPRP